MNLLCGQKMNFLKSPAPDLQLFEKVEKLAQNDPQNQKPPPLAPRDPRGPNPMGHSSSLVGTSSTRGNIFGNSIYPIPHLVNFLRHPLLNVIKYFEHLSDYIHLYLTVYKS